MKKETLDCFTKIINSIIIKNYGEVQNLPATQHAVAYANSYELMQM